MKKRNWYDLSDKEIDKLENKWKNSKWYECAKKESKKIKPNNGGYYACIILYIMFVLFGTVVYIKTNSSSEAILYILIGIIFLIPVLIMEKNEKDDYIEKRKSEWLKEKHNIEKK